MKTPCTALALALATLAVGLAAGGCAQPQPPTGLMDVAERPGEKALLAGLRAYDDAQYAESEKQLNLALKTGLASPKDRAAAHKHLAFLYCSSKRMAECEAAFRTARQEDPTFALSKSEAGHPLWGPVYQRIRP
jgi:Tfp pilus assembly protein PilF